ncbi:hypothetical protein LEMLEM_LOCUS15170, partial [Lemmus lemmus]
MKRSPERWTPAENKRLLRPPPTDMLFFKPRNLRSSLGTTHCLFSPGEVPEAELLQGLVPAMVLASFCHGPHRP